MRGGHKEIIPQPIHVISDKSMRTEMDAPDPNERGRGKKLVARAIIRHSDGSTTDIELVRSQRFSFLGSPGYE